MHHGQIVWGANTHAGEDLSSWSPQPGTRKKGTVTILVAKSPGTLSVPKRISSSQKPPQFSAITEFIITISVPSWGKRLREVTETKPHGYLGFQLQHSYSRTQY